MIEFIPDPHPGEILYSVWARFCDYAQYPSREDVLCELFGNKNAVPVVDLPHHLGYFVANLPFEHSYTVDSLINLHTLFPFYAPFLPQDRLCRLKEHMVSDNGRAIHKLVGNMGNVTTTASSPLWIRYCPACVEEDKAKFGECYWHRLHQVLGVEVCPLHRTFLENSVVRMRDNVRPEARQLISAEQAICATKPRLVTPSPLNDALLDIAKAVDTLLEHSFLPLDDQFLRRQYQAILAQRGFMTLHGLVRTGDLLKAFADYYPPELLSLLNSEIKQTRPSSKTWLSTFMHLSGSVRHPLHHILIIHFLGSTVEAFLSQEIPYPQPFGKGPWPCLNPVCEHYHQRHIHVCQMNEESGKGLLVGKFSCSCGFVYSRSGPDQSPEDIFRRDKILAYGSLWEAKLRELWFDPTVKLQDIAHELGVTRVTVNRRASQLHLPVPRKSCWTPRSGIKHKGRATKDSSWYRTQWTSLISLAPDESITALRKKLPGVYWWLKTHDGEWLMAHLPPSRQRQKPKNQIPLPFQSLQNHFLDEDAIIQDANTAAAIKACAQRIIDDPGDPKRVTIRKIYINVPELRNLKRRKAPLTIQALQHVVESPETFALRRIRRFMHKCQVERIYPKRKEFLRKVNIDHVIHFPSVRHAYEEAMATVSTMK